MLFPEIDVVGKPYPKGSMVPMVSKSTGRAIMRPSADFELTRWSNKVTDAAAVAWQRPRVDRLVVVGLAFRTPRPTREYHEKDLDKLVRAVLDSLTKAGAYTDDKRVALVLAVKYHIRAEEPLPGVRISLATLEDTRLVFESFYTRLPAAFNATLSTLAL